MQQEGGAPVGRTLQGYRSTEQRRVLVRDGESQPAARSGTGGVGLREALEHARSELGGDARAGVGYRDDACLVPGADVHPGMTAAMLDGVSDQVRDDALDPAAIRGDPALAGDLDVSVPAPAPDDARHQWAQVDRLDVNRLGARVQAGYLHQIVDQPSQPRHIADEQA